MRARLPSPRLTTIARQIEFSYRMDAIRGACDEWDAATPETVEAILEAAARFAAISLEPLNESMDAKSCTLHEGQVTTSQAHRDVWKQYVEAGWPTLESAGEFGGQELPAILAFAAQEQFDRGCPAFGMLPVPQRSLFRLVDVFGDDGMRAQWLPKLSSGEWGATICVSEPAAGSDLRLLRTKARRSEDGTWRIDGQKMWISFGDHDLTEQIGHAVLATTPDEEGQDRPSLFLVPKLLEDGSRNTVTVSRIEEKLGLHGSPTCELEFNGAKATLLGEIGRGLPQLFVMITNMRLAVGAMGLGIASGACDLAMLYAEERLQGGRPGPVPIAEHPDVQIQLLDLVSRTTLLRGLLFATANCADLGKRGDEGAANLAALLLPIVKTLGGETAFECASGAIQVLGGAGYTAEWPAEQALRDARVLTIFEGTTGMQALDLVGRRLIGDTACYDAFMAAVDGLKDDRFLATLRLFEDAVAYLRAEPENVPACATQMLNVVSTVAVAWIAATYTTAQVDDPLLQAAAEHWLDQSEAKARQHFAFMKLNSGRQARYQAVRAILN